MGFLARLPRRRWWGSRSPTAGRWAWRFGDVTHIKQGGNPVSIHRGRFGLLGFRFGPGVLGLGSWVLDKCQDAKTHGHRPKAAFFLLPSAFCLLLFASTGCTRTFWRGRADREVA